MLTPYGRYLRKLRIDGGELLKDMADRLGVTSSYLSAVETGKKAVPVEWNKEIILHYQLSADAERTLTQLAEVSKPEVRLPMPRGTSDLTREAVAVFARRVRDLDEDSLNRVMVILKEKEF